MAMVLQKSRLRLTKAIYFGKPPGGGGGTLTAVSGGNGIVATPGPITGVGSLALGTLTADWTAWDGSVTGGFDVDARNTRQWFNVEAFGAVLDGATDSTAAFNNAIAEAGAKGGNVYIRATVGGGLRFTSGVTIPKNVSLIGDPGVAATVGLSSSKLIADLVGTSITFSSVAPTNYFSVVQDIDIRKGASNPATHFLLNNAWFVYFKRIYTQGGTSEVVKTTGNCAQMEFQQFLTQSNPNVGLRLGVGAGDVANNIYLHGNEFAGTAGGVVIAAPLSSVTSVADVIEGCGAAGIRIEGNPTGEALLNVIGGYFEQNTGYDIDINPSGGVGAVVVNVTGGHFAGNGVGPGAIRMNAQCSSLNVQGIRSSTHTVAGIVLASTTIAKIDIGPSNTLNDVTKISSTPAITGSSLISYPGSTDSFVIDGGTLSAATPLTIQSKGAIGPILSLNNYDATSKRSDIDFKQSGVLQWSIRSDPPGTGTTDIRVFDAINTKTPLTIAGNASNGYVGLGDNTSPTRTLDLNGTQRYRGIAAPAVSEANSGTIYFDSGTNKLKASLNGSAYVDVIGSAGLTGSGVATYLAIWDAPTDLTATPIAVANGNGIGIGATYLGGPGAGIGLGVDGDIDISAGSVVSVAGGTILESIAGTNIIKVGDGIGAAGLGSTVVGSAAMSGGTGTNATLIGQGAGAAISGDANSGVGRFALLGTTTGANNTAIGQSSGLSNTTGSDNVFLGFESNATVGNLTNAVAIGYQAVVAANDSMVLGNGTMNVGIRTSTPKLPLDVNGAIGTRHHDVAFVNGLNSDVVPTLTSWIRATGPTAPFSIGGFTDGMDGRLMLIRNTTAFQMTLNHLDGGSAAANQISTPTAAPINCSRALLAYEDTDDLWFVISYS